MTMTSRESDLAVLAMPEVPPDDAERYAMLSDRELLYSVLNEIRALRGSHEEIKALTTQLIEQVNPAIEAIAGGPIGKILGIGK